jgi:type II pantothenate kinase
MLDLSRRMKLGIDFGSSITDVVKLDSGKVISTYSTDLIPLEDIVKKFGKVSDIFATGCGSLHLPEKCNNIKIHKVDEITAIGLGGSFISNIHNGIIISIGSGTCIVSKIKDKIRHIGGTAIGGKTVTGLGKLILNTNIISQIENLAVNGDLSRVDLHIDQIYPDGLGLLPKTATASHFGNLNNATKSDLAMGIFNMIAQSIGTLAVFAAKSENQSKIILTGRLTKIKIFRKIIETRINTLHSIRVIIPNYSEYATAIGAVIGGNY